jgi:hypothetical protein
LVGDGRPIDDRTQDRAGGDEQDERRYQRDHAESSSGFTKHASFAWSILLLAQTPEFLLEEGWSLVARRHRTFEDAPDRG